MNPLVEADTPIDGQAAKIATEVLHERVEAAACCERVGTEPGIPLPHRFILAVTGNRVYVLEHRRIRGELAPGGVVHSWDRNHFLARIPSPFSGRVCGLPPDRQPFTLVALTPGSDHRARAGGRHRTALGGDAYRCLVEKGAAADALIDALVPPYVRSNLTLAGVSLADLA